jgi:hypothetical protein
LLFAILGGKVSNFIPHPCKPAEKVYFMADVPHLYKNIKASLINKLRFTIPEEICKEENLPSQTASIGPVADLAAFQVGLLFNQLNLI